MSIVRCKIFGDLIVVAVESSENFFVILWGEEGAPFKVH